MRCPQCGANKDRVIDSRSSDHDRTIRRRRECAACGRRFTTYERVEETVRLSVVKRDGSRVPYNRQKVLAGLEKACYKRPVSAERLGKMVDQIEEELFRRFEREVDSKEIGQLAAEHLKAADQVAYVRYASVYKQFSDIEDLLDDVKDVIESKANTDPPTQGKLF